MYLKKLVNDDIFVKNFIFNEIIEVYVLMAIFKTQNQFQYISIEILKWWKYTTDFILMEYTMLTNVWLS